MTNEEIVLRYPHFCKIGEDGVLELYCDNHMLSSFRKCQGYFEEQFMSPTGKMLVPNGRVWSLEFGLYLHKCMEYFYQAQRDDWEGTFKYLNDPPLRQEAVTWLGICSDLWEDYDLNWFMLPEFEKTIGKNARALGGHDGALHLYSQYYNTHWRRERFRYVGWELSFGRAKEVPIGFITDSSDISPENKSVICRFYYCGRIDLIVDDSEIIGPMDHKTAAYFDGTESDRFKPHDGMQGYVYSVQQMMGNDPKMLGKMCNSIIINHISVRETKEPGERFKQSIKPYTLREMNAWLQRQRTTFKQIYNILANDEAVTWNTELCNMWYYNTKCPYKKLHQSPDAYREGLIKIDYTYKDAWSPYAVR